MLALSWFLEVEVRSTKSLATGLGLSPALVFILALWFTLLLLFPRLGFELMSMTWELPLKFDVLSLSPNDVGAYSF